MSHRRFVLGVYLLTTGCLLGCGETGDDAEAVDKSPPAAARVTTAAPPAATATADRQLPKIRPEDLPPPVALVADDWPQFRGSKRDNVVESSVPLSRAWGSEGPPLLWQTKVGQGYSSPSVVAGRVYLNDYDEATNEWMVRCLNLDNGEELWTYKVAKRIRPNHAITRSAPATDGSFVFSIDPKCELHCLDARNGNLIWKKRLPEEYESPIPAWYNGQCPLLDDGKLVVATGGKALMVAFEKATGEPIWETPNEQQFLLSHSSIMPVEIDGVPQYAYTTLKGLVGVAADSGELLWHFPWKFNTAVSTTPLPVGDAKFLLTSGYHAQTVVCEVKREGDAWQASQLAAFDPPPRGWNSEVHTPVYHRGFVYGVGKVKRGLWTCLDLEGNELWDSSRKASFGMGGYVLADGMFFVLEGKTGTLRLVDAEADEYRELASATLLSGPDVWAPPVISGGKLLIRDLGKLLCLDVAAGENSLAAIPSNNGP